MTRIRVGAAVLNQTPLDWEGNRANILAAIQAAREVGVQVLCLPELCITGYGCEDMFLSASTAQTAWQVLEEIAPATQGMAVSVGLPLLHRDALFNAACLAVDGQIAGFAAKRFLASQGLHYEPRWFKPWSTGLRDLLHVQNRAYPIGDLVFDVGGVRIGFEICEDAWAARRPGGDLSLQGIDLLLNPSASHFAFGKFEVRKRLVLEGARAFGVSYIYANLV
ncbi:MAG TPA: nitrilase-related carbon-nitrogen hydrolase, partial [Thermoguttaceae bacterium]|nr:nitrilase-related carbon-nitrogen hydrolase [Thermoguttaceae bacterium]